MFKTLFFNKFVNPAQRWNHYIWSKPFELSHPVSIPGYLKILIVKLIWIWNFLWKWSRIPTLPVNIHLAKPYSWFWVSLLPGHGWRLRCVFSFSCVQTLWDSTDTTYFACGITGISFQAFETSLLYIKILNICSFLGWAYLLHPTVQTPGSSQSHQVSTSKCRSTVQFNVLEILRVVGQRPVEHKAEWQLRFVPLP